MCASDLAEKGGKAYLFFTPHTDALVYELYTETGYMRTDI